jgi:hypothetical protein
MKIPGLGTVTKDNRSDYYYSDLISVQVLGGQLCRIVVEGYDEDPAKEEFHAAIKNFLSLDQSVLKDVESYVFQYYQDCNANWEADDDEFLVIVSPEDIWRHVHFGSEPVVTRRDDGDEGIYVSLECNCVWEEEHGLQIVFKNGLRVNKVGPYDGHLTNSDAYDDDSLEDVIYP